MPYKQKTFLNWSSGKDAAYAMYLLQKSDTYNVAQLLTTVNAERNKIVMHGVREELLDAQAQRVGLPLKKLMLPAAPTDDMYKKLMRETVTQLKADGFEAAAFGDIHLEDLKAYREEQLSEVGMKTHFPLWKMDTAEIVSMVEQVGIGAVLVCVNGRLLGKEFLGRTVDSMLLADLPDNVDPCGEYGEFHTFVYNAPYFSAPINYKKGETITQKYAVDSSESEFHFLDILPD